MHSTRMKWIAMALLLSSTAAAQWGPRNTGLPNTMGFVHGINTIAQSDSAIFATTNNQVLRSKDEGASWTDITTGLPAAVRIDWIVSNGPTVFITWHTTPGTASGGMHRSTDHGSTWVSTGLTIGGNYINAIHASGDTIVAYAGSPRLIRSTDGGTTWTDGPVPPTRGQSIFRRGSDIYLGSDIATHRSPDFGATWSQLSGIGGTWTFAMDGDALHAGTRPAVLRTKDMGQTWDTLSAGMPSGVDTWTLYVAGNKMVAGLQRASFSSGAYISNDSGATWSAWKEGLPNNAKVNTLVARGDMLYAATTGVYRRSLSATVSVASAARKAGSITLEPGPAGSRTIRLDGISDAGMVKVGVHSVTGKEILRGVVYSGSGGNSRQLRLPAGSPGLIFVTVTEEGLTSTQKMILR